MSTKSDKTKEKLLSSMRKTKAGTAETPASPAAPAPKTAAPKTAAPEAKVKPKAKPATKAVSADSYQVGQRIWPD